MKRLAKDLVITPVKKANIIEVKYTSRSPEKAAAVLRKLEDFIWRSTSNCTGPRAPTNFSRPRRTNRKLNCRKLRKVSRVFSSQ